MLIRDLVHMGHEVHHDAPDGDLLVEEHHEVTLLTSCSYPRHVPHLPYMETCELQSIHSHPGMTGLTLE